MKKLLIIILFSIINLFSQSDVLTLKESIEIGLKNSKDLKISHSKVIYSDAKVTEVRSNLFPNISFNASYARLSDIPPFSVNVPFAPQPITIQDPILNNYSFKLSLQQPLFTGFKLLSLKDAADYNKQATELDYDKDVNEEAFNITNAFWNYYKTQKLKEFIEENLQSISAHVEDTKNFMENGLVTKNDFLKLKVQHSTLELKLIDAENAVKISQAMFNKTIGLQLNKDTQIKTNEFEIPDKLNFNYDELLRKAEEQRLEIRSLDYRLNAADEKIDVASSNWYPSVFLFGNYYYSKPNQRILPLEDKFNDTWDVGVTLSWDIYNWGNNSAKTEQAQQEYFQLQTKKEQLEEGIEIEVYNNYLSVISSFKKVKVNELNLQQTEENYRITKDKYNQQLATSTDLIDAETSVLQAKTELINSKVEFVIATTRLEKSIGEKIY